MSWQGYIDTSLLATKKVDAAAIFSKAGDSVWAASPGFNIKPEEVKTIIGGFADPQPLRVNGIYVGGVKHIALKTDDKSIYAKLDKTGLICILTNQAFIIAHFPETAQPGEAAIVVEKLGDYLRGVGY